MIRIRPAESRGRYRNAWLDARFSFSFGTYRDAAFDGYSDLLVLNDDVVAPGGGFAPHGHRDVEVMSYPLHGEVEHRDSLGHVARIGRGDVHLMRAGTGIVHSEMNASATLSERHLQWWIRPADTGLAPAYARLRVQPDAVSDRWTPLATPDGAGGSLHLAQDARVLRGRIDAGTIVHRPADGRWTHVHVVEGRPTIEGRALRAGDGVFAENEAALAFGVRDGEPAELLLFDLRPMR